MTPQEIFEYKNKWKSDLHYYHITHDWFVPHQFCKNNFEKHRWDAKKYARPDDSHEFVFERGEDYRKFVDFVENYYDKN